MTAPAIFLDLDGTLIGPSGDVHPTVWEALDATRDAGVRLSVCTGRPSGGLASRIARRMGVDVPHIYHGGAVIMTGDGCMVRSESMPKSGLAAMIDRARRDGLTLELYTADTIWVDEMSPVHARHLSLLGEGVKGSVGDLKALVEHADIVKAQWIIFDADLAEELAVKTAEGCFAARGDSQAMSKARFVTITREGVDKGCAVRHVAESLGVDLKACMAVGDSTGDLPMLEAVGRPYVMADAPAAVRARFPVIPSVVDHGILEVLLGH